MASGDRGGRARSPARSERAGRSLAVFLGGVAVAVAVAAAWIPLRATNSDVVVALALVLVIALTGGAGRRAAVAGATIGAAAAFTFFDTEPYERFAFARQPDIATAACLVAVGLTVGELAVRFARGRRAEATAVLDLRRVRTAAALLAEGEEVVTLIGAVAAEMARMAGVQEASFTAEELPAGTPVVDRSGATDRSRAPGCLAVPVVALGQVVGHFLLWPGGAAALSAGQLQLAVTLADQVGAALAAQTLLPGAPGPSVRRPPDGPRLRVLRHP